jgi:NADH-quinone oxidoreductase subunit M
MDFLAKNLLTILILAPVVGAALVLAHQAFWKQESQLKWLTLVVTLFNFLASLFLLSDKGIPGPGGFFFEQSVPWIKAINANYHVGVDGLSLWLVLLTTFIMPITILSTWHAVEKKATAFYIFLLLLESAMIGVFVSLDLLVFYLFFEASLVPMFFLLAYGAERTAFTRRSSSLFSRL